MHSLGALLLKLLDYYGNSFDPRTMGVVVGRAGGRGTFVARTGLGGRGAMVGIPTSEGGSEVGGVRAGVGCVGSPMLSPPPTPPQPRHSLDAAERIRISRRAASEAGDWRPPTDILIPARKLVRTNSSALVFPATGRHVSPLNGAQLSKIGPLSHTANMFDFDPLFIEDPLRPDNNVGRNCFRIYAIQQEFRACAEVARTCSSMAFDKGVLAGVLQTEAFVCGSN